MTSERVGPSETERQCPFTLFPAGEEGDPRLNLWQKDAKGKKIRVTRRVPFCTEGSVSVNLPALSPQEYGEIVSWADYIIPRQFDEMGGENYADSSSIDPEKKLIFRRTNEIIHKERKGQSVSSWLDIGCGSLQYLQEMVDLHNIPHVGAFDPGPSMVQEARKNAAALEGNASVDVWQGSIQKPKIPESMRAAMWERRGGINIVSAFFAIHFVQREPLLGLFKTLSDITQPGDIVVASTVDVTMANLLGGLPSIPKGKEALWTVPAPFLLTSEDPRKVTYMQKHVTLYPKTLDEMEYIAGKTGFSVRKSHVYVDREYRQNIEDDTTDYGKMKKMAYPILGIPDDIYVLIRR